MNHEAWPWLRYIVTTSPVQTFCTTGVYVPPLRPFREPIQPPASCPSCAAPPELPDRCAYCGRRWRGL